MDEIITKTELMHEINRAKEELREEMRRHFQHSDVVAEDSNKNITETESTIVDNELAIAELDRRVTALEQKGE